MLKPALITARLKSARLKEKVLLRIDGVSLLEILVRRLQISFSPVIVCTSHLDSDVALIKEAEDIDAHVFLGHPDDVIKRLTDCAEEWGFEHFLNVTADNPLVDIEVADRIFSELVRNPNLDFVSTSRCPIGFFSYAVKTSAARRVCEVKDKDDTENWHPYFSALTEIITKKVDIGIEEHEKLRFTVDYLEDYEFLSKVLELGKENGINQMSSMDKILGYLKTVPELLSINENCAQAPEKTIAIRQN